MFRWIRKFFNKQPSVLSKSNTMEFLIDGFRYTINYHPFAKHWMIIIRGQDQFHLETFKTEKSLLQAFPDVLKYILFQHQLKGMLNDESKPK